MSKSCGLLGLALALRLSHARREAVPLGSRIGARAASETMVGGRTVAIAVLFTACGAFSHPSRDGLRLDPFPPQQGGSLPSAAAAPPCAPSTTLAKSAAAATAPCSAPAAGTRLELDATRSTLALGEGRWVVAVQVPASHYVTIGVSGPATALAGFEVVGRRSLQRLRTGTLHDDGRLPTFVGFETRAESERLMVVVDLRQPATLLCAVADAREPTRPPAGASAAGAEPPRPLVGMPFPTERRSGYFIQTAPRYAFVRSDVAAALRDAFRRTRARFEQGGAIAVGDASEWNGARPATDRDRPRHIGHEQGREVDLGLASPRALSRIEPRCDGVLGAEDRFECAPGTARDFDAARTAYLLARLLEPPPQHRRPIADVEAILTDQVFVDAIRQALPGLRRKQWIGAEAFALLGEQGLLRHSPWHVDHVHVRFRAAPTIVPAELRFEAEPVAASATPLGP